MLLPIRPICTASKIRKNGTSLIFLQYCHSAGNKTLLNTEISIPPNYWNKRRCCINEDLPPEYGKVAELNKEVQRQLRVAEDLISVAIEKGTKDPVAFVKGLYYPKLNLPNAKNNLKEPEPSVNLDFAYQFYQYIESKRRKISKATLNVYSEVLRHIQAFEGHTKTKVNFESFTHDFYDGFVDFLTYDYTSYRFKNSQGLKVNTIGKTIKHLRSFLKDRMSRKIIAEFDLSMFKTMEEPADAIYLNTQEIQAIYNLDLSNDHYLEQHRDLFVLGCYTGLRFSDFSIISKEDVRNGMLHKKQEKSNHWVIIPLRTTARSILEEKFKDGIPQVSNSEFNGTIKQIGKLAGLNSTIKFSHKQGNRKIVTTKPKHNWITSHTCRRSFCTNEFLAGTPVELIMKISGHKSLKDFYKYIKISPEEAAGKIREIWSNRGELQSTNQSI